MNFLYGLLTALGIVAIGRLFGMRLGLFPALQAGETILYRKPYIKLATGLSFPNYRWSFSLPPLMEHGLFVTHRRILHVMFFLRLFRLDFSQWFNGMDVPKDGDRVTDIRIGTHRPGGSYLEITSETSERLWYRSKACRMRLYMKDAENLMAVIAEAMQNE